MRAQAHVLQRPMARFSIQQQQEQDDDDYSNRSKCIGHCRLKSVFYIKNNEKISQSALRFALITSRTSMLRQQIFHANEPLLAVILFA